MKESRHKALSALRAKSDNVKHAYLDSCQSLIEEVMYQEWEKIKKEDTKLPSLLLRNDSPIPYVRQLFFKSNKCSAFFVTLFLDCVNDYSDCEISEHTDTVVLTSSLSSNSI